MTAAARDIRVVDLFSGIGGLTHGFKAAGLKVVAGIDNDGSCKYGYEMSNKTPFILRDIEKVSSEEVDALFGDAEIRVLAGCAPCQPYSRLNQKVATDQKMAPLKKFASLIAEVRPDIVSMENVAGLMDTKKYPIFGDFLRVLKKLGYFYDFKVINTADYGVPQNRKRLVLLASSLGPISIPDPTHQKHLTLRDAIADLPTIKDGVTNLDDPLHYSRKLNAVNKKRIRATPKDGGTQKSWPKELLLDCHKRDTGKSFAVSVYGRMWWDRPASTMTTQCVGLGNGRFGHPDQNRAISLREAARIQTFPDSYVFFNRESVMTVGAVAKFIGNAVPVRLGEVLGLAIRKHVKNV